MLRALLLVTPAKYLIFYIESVKVLKVVKSFEVFYYFEVLTLNDYSVCRSRLRYSINERIHFDSIQFCESL